MDLQMPEMDGVEATGQIVRRFPEVKVVILTSFGETERVHAALEQGASGYLLKDASPAEVEGRCGPRCATRSSWTPPSPGA
ncbi:response regulator transcription factor [Blastococcus brunescens]|uniref:Response regulator transcription factor n=1 Tax=Blastococcus brunescens TaxID=1564165 RepID=A0ABZ1B4J9_9ACTN|nr:response regulator transcription factor [Blastococcus sp. BMG 8361]WRL65720.1 response regulator transcription factor [Blastococcus sp. BMG 8361]